MGVAVKNGTINRQYVGHTVSKSGVEKPEGMSQSAVKDGQVYVSKSNQNEDVNGISDVSNLKPHQSQIQASEWVKHDNGVLSKDDQTGVSGKGKVAGFLEKIILHF